MEKAWKAKYISMPRIIRGIFSILVSDQSFSKPPFKDEQIRPDHKPIYLDKEWLTNFFLKRFFELTTLKPHPWSYLMRFVSPLCLYFTSVWQSLWSMKTPKCAPVVDARDASHDNILKHKTTSSNVYCKSRCMFEHSAYTHINDSRWRK